MKKSQLIEILLILGKKERREARKWLLSPIHNQREDVVLLFDYLTAGQHLEDPKFLAKERVYKRIFPGEVFSDPKIRQTIHFLHKSIEEYLAYKHWQEDEIRQKLSLTAAYRLRKLKKPLDKSLQHLEKMQEESPYRDENFYWHEYYLQLERYDQMAKQGQNNQLNLQEVSNVLDKSYMIAKLKLSCRMLFHQSLRKTDYNYSLAKELISYIEQEHFIEDPSIAVYYYIYKALTDKGEHDYFERLRAQINEHYEMFPDDDLREIYLMAINYCIARINSGQDEYVRESFEWYRQGLDQKILIINGTINQRTYLNIVMNGLKLQEFNWTDHFIDAYKQYLPERHRDNSSNFSRVKYLFDTKNYDAARDLITRTNFDDILLNLMAKSTLLKIYYEHDEFDAMETHLESFRVYLKRKDVIGYHRQIYSNLVTYSRKLIRVNPFDKKEVAKLKTEIETASPLVEKQWLLERLAEL